MEMAVGGWGRAEPAAGGGVGAAWGDEVVVVHCGQRQVAVPDRSLHVAAVGAGAEAEVPEATPWLESGVGNRLVHRRHLERAHDLVTGVEPGATLARHPSETE